VTIVDTDECVGHVLATDAGRSALAKVLHDGNHVVFVEPTELHNQVRDSLRSLELVLMHCAQMCRFLPLHAIIVGDDATAHVLAAAHHPSPPDLEEVRALSALISFAHLALFKVTAPYLDAKMFLPMDGASELDGIDPPEAASAPEKAPEAIAPAPAAAIAGACANFVLVRPFCFSSCAHLIFCGSALRTTPTFALLLRRLKMNRPPSVCAHSRGRTCPAMRRTTST